MDSQHNYLSVDALEDVLAKIPAGERISCKPNQITITRDQVKRFGTPEALSQWDAQFPHGNVLINTEISGTISEQP